MICYERDTIAKQYVSNQTSNTTRQHLTDKKYTLSHVYRRPKDFSGPLLAQEPPSAAMYVHTTDQQMTHNRNTVHGYFKYKAMTMSPRFK